MKSLNTGQLQAVQVSHNKPKAKTALEAATSYHISQQPKQ